MRLMARRASAAALAMEKQPAIEAGEKQPQPQYIRSEPRMPSADGSEESSSSEEYNLPMEEAVKDPTTIEVRRTAMNHPSPHLLSFRPCLLTLSTVSANIFATINSAGGSSFRASRNDD